MKAKANNKGKKETVSIPKKGLLSLVASQLKDRNLFPEKVEEARKYLRKLKKSHS